MPVGYDKIKGLKRPNTSISYTLEQVKEFAKCSQDILYFAEKYFVIIEEKRGRHVIQLFDYQKETLKMFVDNRFVVLNFARQMGKSTCLSIYILWLAMFFEDKLIGILSNKEESAKSLMRDIKTAYLELPDFLKQGAPKWDQTVIGFDNGSMIMGGTTAEDSFRGESLSLLALDEFAHVPQEIAENFFTSAFPTISTGGRMIVVSTPNGSVGKFFDIFTNAGKTVNGSQSPFKSLKVPWHKHPDRDEKWKQDTLAILGKIKFNQEHECSFAGSTNTLIDGDSLSRINQTVLDPTWIIEEGFYLWKQPVKGKIYAFGVDISEGAGAGSDYSVINIFDVTHFNTTGKYDQIGMFRRNDIILEEFINKIYEISKKFFNPVIVIENNTLGDVVCRALYNDKEYENIYFDYDRAEHGINANKKTKPMALNFFKGDIESGSLFIRSKDMLTELGYFEEVNPGIFKARRGKSFHDDTISSAYWVSYALRSRYFQDDVLFYANQNTESVDENEDESGSDEDILNSFNKFSRKLTDKEMFRNDLYRG